MGQLPLSLTPPPCHASLADSCVSSESRLTTLSILYRQVLFLIFFLLFSVNISRQLAPDDPEGPNHSSLQHRKCLPLGCYYSDLIYPRALCFTNFRCYDSFPKSLRMQQQLPVSEPRVSDCQRGVPDRLTATRAVCRASRHTGSRN